MTWEKEVRCTLWLCVIGLFIIALLLLNKTMVLGDKIRELQAEVKCMNMRVDLYKERLNATRN